MLTSTQDLERISPEWKQLWAAVPGATAFQSPEWLVPWWETVGEGALYVLAVRDRNARLAGLLPLYIYTQPANGERHLLLLGAGTSDYLDGLFACDRASSGPVEEVGSPLAGASGMGTTAAALSFLAEQDSAWDRAIFHQLPADSLLLGRARLAGWAVHPSESCSVVAVNGLSGLPARIRANIGRYRRRAQVRGSLRCHMAGSLDEALQGLEQLITLHARRWHTRGEGGVLSAQAIQAHHRAAIPALYTAGLLQMFSLQLAGSTIAVLYTLVNGAQRTSQDKTLACYLIGFEPECSDLSPGTMLLASVLEYCTAQGFASMDLLRGGEAYKRLWGAVDQPTFGFEMPRGSPALA